ncbi:hypothetical protein A2272_00820 [Candidatus Peregrinibacteria bacterium RIFOXYA12_FULL_33_12]|nr:MAG: hypothetical protein A2263_01220 [Candidatus Peregrinibacteria bacterium RIFOXYA2_FULL_33_21]OGJ46834.1 MAG: hypothetical protein A2272_00820 [Candidatus Peregrinibacteria bacterium RIFOXYA12_FULL_33_12]OGJ51304.1 MAG: hypothetical protein A2307_00495 [Candidatus Peregrinibacteria bacterium RIFOXYB2_FULL_33_20]
MLDFSHYISTDKKGIWRYQVLLGGKRKKEKGGDFLKLNLENKLTPFEKGEDLGKILGIENVYLKREDLNELGSFKSRSLAYQVSYYKNLGYKSLVISSSGNGAICAAKYCDLAGIKLFCFISKETDLGKKAILAETNAIVVETERAIRFGSYVSAKYKMPNLRPSVDDVSLIGFESLAYEIWEQIRMTDVFLVFSFVTSGSSFIGMYNGFKKLLELGALKKLPRMFAVQGGAGKLGVKNSRRMAEILRIVKETGGRMIEVTAEEILKQHRQCLDISRQVSEEGMAVLAAITHSISFLKKDRTGLNVVAIMSGKNWLKNVKQKRKFLKAESFEEVDRIVKIIL